MLDRLAAVLALLALAVGPQVIIRPDPPPVLNTLAPTSGAVGASFDLTGKNFGNKQENSIVTVRGVPAIVTFWNPTHITAIVPTLPTTGAGPVVVTVGMQPSNGLTYNVTFVPAVLTSLSVNSGPIGTSVTLTGTNFGATVGTSTIRFNGILATASTWSNTSITTTVPVGASTGPVTVTVGGVTTNGITFTVTTTPAPVLSSLSVPSGPVGTTVILSGSNFGATQGTSLVTFFGTAATASAWSATSITVTVPAGASSGQVQVIVGGFASNGIVFTVTPTPPVLTSLNFNTGPVGTLVTITGTNLGATQGASTVAFNGLVAAVSGWSATSINTQVPIGATTGPVTVTVGGVQSNGLTFTVTSGGGGTVFTAITCNWQDVVDAESRAYAATGPTGAATVIIPAGTCTDWPAHAVGSQALISGADNWPVTFQGAGGTATTIDATAANGLRTLELGVGPNRVTGIRFLCGQVSVAGSGFRVDHNIFECHQHNYQIWGTALYAFDTNKQHAGFNPLTDDLRGLVDNNTFIDQRAVIYQFQANVIPENQGSTLWSKPLGLGGPNALYLEDNTFTFESFNDTFDCDESGMIVFRYNAVVDSYTETHPARGGARGCRKWEIYNDTFTSTNAIPMNTSQAFLIRGGTGVMFGNRYSGIWGSNNGTIQVLRATEDLGPGSWGLCNGTNPWDGNQDATGWPCLDIFRGGDFTGPFNASPPPYTPPVQLLEAAYWWDNQINGNQLGVNPFDAPTAARLQLNRDYFVSPSTAKPGYTPYQYPHPLQGPPTLVSLSVPSGLVGTTVTLTGAAWGARQNASIVRFNGTTAVVSAWTKTSITTTVPAGATTGNVTVTVNGTQSNGLAFTVTPPPAPTLTSLSTTTGPVGTQVTLAGTNFGATQGTSSVAFNGTTATATAWSATSITTTVPAGATTGQVRVTVGGVLSNGIQFTVTNPATCTNPCPVVVNGEGYGMTTRAAYGSATPPTVMRVTALTDNGSAGELRAALEASVPRIVVFETSGTIQLSNYIFVGNPYLTVAGQTAPNPGITIRNFGIQIQTHDVLIQHLRIRAGDGPPLIPQTADHDSLTVYADSNGPDADNIVFDHNSVSWAQGKNTESLSLKEGARMTWWRNITSEALYHGKNVTGVTNNVSSLGMAIAQNYTADAGNPASGHNTFVSALGNLLAHNSDRNPELQGPTHVHFINNVIYDWGKDGEGGGYPWATFLYWQASIPGLTLSTLGPYADVIGNQYIAGPPRSPNTLPALVAIGAYAMQPDAKLYRLDNAIDQTRQPVTAYTVQGGGADPTVGTPPVPLTGITVRPSSQTQAFVLANAGARPLNRDAVDLRIINEVTTRTGDVISSQDAVGGWPTLAVNTRAFVIPSNPNTINPATGYTNLEDTLHAAAAALEP